MIGVVTITDVILNSTIKILRDTSFGSENILKRRTLELRFRKNNLLVSADSAP